MRGLFFEQEELAVPRRAAAARDEYRRCRRQHRKPHAVLRKRDASKRVIPIEPIPRAAAAIRAAVAENRLDKRRSLLPRPRRRAARRAVCAPIPSDGRTRRDALRCRTRLAMLPVMPLDELVSGPVDFIKIDVEGMEMEALAGAARIIAAQRPLLYVEVVDETVADFMRWVDANGYRVEKLFPDKTHCNYFLVPSERTRGSAGMNVRTMLQAGSCCLTFGAALAHSSASAAAPRPRLVEPPFFAEAVAAGNLPPVAERMPEHPSVVSYAGTEKKPGQYGGTLRILGGSAKDTRLMVIYGYARLVGYTPDFEIVPDIAESVDVEENRVFTFHLRPGHRWSDGEPFTSEDFRFYWEDVANDAEVSRFGPPQGAARRRREAGRGVPRRGDGPLHLVEAEPVFPAGARRGAAGRDLPPLALPEEIPRQICRARRR